jgi:hypothetical protein
MGATTLKETSFWQGRRENTHVFPRTACRFSSYLRGEGSSFSHAHPKIPERGCCERTDHAPNNGLNNICARWIAGGYYKDFLFTSGLRGFTILNPGLYAFLWWRTGRVCGAGILFIPPRKGIARLRTSFVKRQGGPAAARNGREATSSLQARK